MHYASVEAGTIRRKKNGLWSIECIIFQDLWLIWNAIKILHFVDWFQKVKSAAIWKRHQKEMSVNWRKNRWKVYISSIFQIKSLYKNISSNHSKNQYECNEIAQFLQSFWKNSVKSINSYNARIIKSYFELISRKIRHMKT